MMAWLQQLHWREPLWLLLVLQPLLIWLLHKLWQGRQLTAYADRALQPWVLVYEKSAWHKRLISRNNAYILAWLLLAVAAAGPRLPLYGQQVNADKGMNIMVVMDTSRSMTVSDILPNRLRRAELELHEMLIKAQGQRVGVIVYAARPHVFVPLTWDFAALRYYLQSLDKLILPTRGSQLVDALALAKDTLVAAPQYAAIPSAIVLISDGDSGDTGQTIHQHINPLMSELQQLDLPVYVLGVGSTEGSAIPLEDGSWLSYDNKPVISRMDESLLHYIAQSSGGKYSRAAEDDSDWRRLYDQGMLSKLAQDDDSERLWLELYPWVLFPAIVLFFIAVMPFRLRRPLLLSATALVTTAMLFHNISQAADAPPGQQAYQAYQQRQYDIAVKQYSNVPGYVGSLGEGAAHYRLGDYQAAKRRFSDAVLQADNDQQRAGALFNLGNSYFQQGDYQTAAQAFADVLRYQNNHAAARHNLAISKTLHQQVTQVLMEQDNATMAGRGPRSARAVRELNLSEDSSLAIDDSEEDRPPIIPELPDADQQAWQELIRKGQYFVQLAASGKSDQEMRQRQQDLAQARLFMLQLQDQPATLWQRLFELEEGFIAPQSQPHEIPGVAPW
jgi:Ca-activated chloride channel family protein